MNHKFFVLLSFCLIGWSGAQAHELFCQDLSRLEFAEPMTDGEWSRFVESSRIDRILISKDQRELYLLQGRKVVKTYSVAFGSSPVGHKQFEGDQKTPEGLYTINYKNPKSAFYLSLRISYPNKDDREYAKSQGRSPGGDIMIHGLPSKDINKRRLVEIVHPMVNWTNGCVAVNDQEIYDIYRLVRTGTLVEICPFSERSLTDILMPFGISLF